MTIMTVKLDFWWLHMETAKELSEQEYPPPIIGSRIPVLDVQDKAAVQALPGSSSAAVGSKQKGKAPGSRS